MPCAKNKQTTKQKTKPNQQQQKAHRVNDVEMFAPFLLSHFYRVPILTLFGFLLGNDVAQLCDIAPRCLCSHF